MGNRLVAEGGDMKRNKPYPYYDNPLNTDFKYMINKVKRNDGQTVGFVRHIVISFIFNQLYLLTEDRLNRHPSPA